MLSIGVRDGSGSHHEVWQAGAYMRTKNRRLDGAMLAEISKATCHVGMCWFV